MSTEFPSALGTLIRKRRLDLGVTQEQLASAAGLHVNYISALERGVYNVTVIKLRCIATALKTSAAELIESAETDCS